MTEKNWNPKERLKIDRLIFSFGEIRNYLFEINNFVWCGHHFSKSLNMPNQTEQNKILKMVKKLKNSIINQFSQGYFLPNRPKCWLFYVFYKLLDNKYNAVNILIRCQIDPIYLKLWIAIFQNKITYMFS